MPSNSNAIPIAVRHLAGLCGRKGDLAPVHFSAVRGVEGTRTHQRLQKNRGPDYSAELPVSLTWEGTELSFELRGRIDGLQRSVRGDEIEEIKTSSLPEGMLPDDAPVHWLQACLYAAIWLRMHPADSSVVTVRYAPPAQGEGWCRSQRLSAEELDALLERCCSELEADVLRRRAWQEARDRSLSRLTFPFPGLRPGQQELMDAVSDTLRSGGVLFAEAPTGIGKTMAVLLPALQAIGRGEGARFMFLTSRNAGKRIAEEALALLRIQGARIRVLTLVARDRVCHEVDTPCRPRECPSAKGFYERLPAALEALRQFDDWTEARWTEVARDHQLCPYAFSLHAAREADGFIGDVNYAFDPAASLRWLFESEEEAPILLVDEAHQLAARARGMFSAELSLTRLRKILRVLKGGSSPVAPALDRFLRQLREAAREGQDVPRFQARCSEELPSALLFQARLLLEALERVVMEEQDPGAARPEEEELRRMVMGFLRTAELAGPEHLMLYERERSVLFCRDAAPALRDRLRQAPAAVLFSATLQPWSYRLRECGGQAEDRTLALASPYPPEHLQVTLATGLRTTYEARSPELYDRLAARILDFLAANPGNALVFLPSYALLRELQARLPAWDLLVGEVIAQTPGMQEAEVDAFLSRFRSGHSVTGLAVLGGALNEGIDLPGAALRAVVVVGVGLPQVSLQNECLRDYQEARYDQDGFAAAYSLPGWTRVLQAVGRLIRGEEDRGAALLVDHRYALPFYSQLFPNSWTPSIDERDQ